MVRSGTASFRRPRERRGCASSLRGRGLWRMATLNPNPRAWWQVFNCRYQQDFARNKLQKSQRFCDCLSPSSVVCSHPVEEKSTNQGSLPQSEFSLCLSSAFQLFRWPNTWMSFVF